MPSQPSMPAHDVPHDLVARNLQIAHSTASKDEAAAEASDPDSLESYRLVPLQHETAESLRQLDAIAGADDGWLVEGRSPY